ncbi:MAG: hypothetical protein ACFFC7_22330 [Candidatus Hermodarchaeota archaeon]
MPNLRKLGEAIIKDESIQLPEEVLDYILADEGDNISFFVKEGEIIIRRSSSTDSGKQESKHQEPSFSSRSGEIPPDLIDLRKKIEEIVQKISSEMNIQEKKLLEFSDTLTDRILDLVSPLTKTAKAAPVDPMDMVKSLFGEKGSEVTKNLGKIMGNMFEAFQGALGTSPLREDDDYSDDEIEIEEDDIEDFDEEESGSDDENDYNDSDSKNNDKNRFKIDIE